MDAGRNAPHRRSGWDNTAPEDHDGDCHTEPGSSGAGRSRHRRDDKSYRTHCDRDEYTSSSSSKKYSERDNGHRRHGSWEHDKYEGSSYRRRSRFDEAEDSRYHDYDSDRSKRNKAGGRSRDRSSERDNSIRSQNTQQDEGTQTQHVVLEEAGVSVSIPDNQADEHLTMMASGTLLVKGLPLHTTEDDLYKALEGWGPLKHVRVIKDKGSGISRGFAFIDFPSTESAGKFMEAAGSGLPIGGRRVFFQYSRPAGNNSYSDVRFPGRSRFTAAVPTDWTCSTCSYLNFARRVVCLQCNEPRLEDTLGETTGSGYRGEPAPSHVLIVRGLDENVDEEILHCEFSKYAPIKDLRLIRDKFTHVSRGFAFVHFNSVEEATSTLHATDGVSIDKSGEVLRVAFARSAYASGVNGPQGTLAASAIEAASFAQQYDATGWTPKEFDSKPIDAQNAGFVWDETSGYYFDAASGFYYDPNQGLYYDGNTGAWYTYNQEQQQYEPYVPPAAAGPLEVNDGVNHVTTPRPKTQAVISAPAVISAAAVISAPAVVHTDEKSSTAEARAKKKDKEKAKEIRFAGSIKKRKIGDTMNLWKQRQNEASQKIKDDVPDEETPVKDVPSEPPASRTPRQGNGKTGVVHRNSEDVSTSGAYSSSKRRKFTEVPQTVYRDRAAERRSLYGLSVPGEPQVEDMGQDSGQDMPFPPGVGGRGIPTEAPQPYEVISSDRAIGESNIGNRMLRNMGWQEGKGLGKDERGMVEPVRARKAAERAGLGSHGQQRKVDERFEAQPGDSYRVVIQKKALARFHEML